jgi:cell wall-associated NlpC family hydrolase
MRPALLACLIALSAVAARDARRSPVFDRSGLVVGDLVFYNTRNRPYSHVGIYLGEGRFLHAPRPGAQVRVENLTTPYWSQRFDGARRLDPPTF